MSLTILNAGPQCVVQDLGRVRWRRYGAALAGALDPLAARVANLLVGNDEVAAVLEITPGLTQFQLEHARNIAWCGADFAVRAGGVFLPPGRRCSVPARVVIEFRGPRTGCRAWLAIGGGVDVPGIGGSRATDLRGGFGGHEGRAVKSGDVLRLGRAMIRASRALRIASWGAATTLSRSFPPPVLRVLRSHTAPPELVAELVREPLTVGKDADRMGLRLSTLPGAANAPGELLSEPVVPGTIQLPPGGQPILLLADAQTTGGYAKLAHVITADLRLAAQLRPGDAVSFREVTLAEARDQWRQQERELAFFRAALRCAGELRSSPEGPPEKEKGVPRIATRPSV